jgi:hypothetical protein
LWEKTGDGEDGEPIVTDPIEIPVKWEDVKREVLLPNGTTIGTDATVFVNRLIPLGSIIWLGKLTDITGTDPPTSPTYQVVARDVVPDIKGRASDRTVGVIRFRDTLPEVS